jgi:hypothetical protein
MKRFLSIAAAVALAALGGVVILGASPQEPRQEESKTDKLIKSLTERVDKLEKRVVELEKKLAEKNAGGGLEERFKGLLDKFGDGKDGFKKLFEEFRGGLPEMPEFEGMPDLFQGLDVDQLMEMLKSQFDGQLPGFFDGLDMEGLLDKFKDQLDKKSEPKKKGPKRRSI